MPAIHTGRLTTEMTNFRDGTEPTAGARSGVARVILVKTAGVTADYLIENASRCPKVSPLVSHLLLVHTPF